MKRQSLTTRPFHRVVVVVVAVLFGEVKLVTADIDTLLPDGKKLCETQIATNVNCSLQPSVGPETCKIQPLPIDNCFRLWNCAQNYTVVKNLNFVQRFDEKRYVTTMTLRNYKEKILLLRTFLEGEHWWQVNLPEGEHDVTIFDLPGRLDEQNPVMFPRSPNKSCEGCPLPHVKWIPYKNLHLFQIVVLSESNISFVKVEIYGTNKTNLVNEDCEGPHLLGISAETSGKKNEVLTADQMYSKGHCFMITLFFSSGKKRRLQCLEYEDMTVSLYEAPRAPIEVPIWWIVLLVWVIVCLVVASLVPLMIHKGWLRLHCRGFRHRMERHRNVSRHCEDRRQGHLSELRPSRGDVNASTAPHLRCCGGDESLLQYMKCENNGDRREKVHGQQNPTASCRRNTLYLM